MEMENQGLRNQISVLQSQAQSKDEELNVLRDQLAKSNEVTTTKKVALTKKSAKNKGYLSKKPRTREMEVQIALRNAGFDPGIINGKISKQTILAIKDFQKVNQLKVTGAVNKRTWRYLKVYLNKERKIKTEKVGKLK
jgi:peptidoglycan hydrolase-like protein with peptidoglycan-binding domain